MKIEVVKKINRLYNSRIYDVGEVINVQRSRKDDHKHIEGININYIPQYCVRRLQE